MILVQLQNTLVVEWGKTWLLSPKRVILVQNQNISVLSGENKVIALQIIATWAKIFILNLVMFKYRLL